MYRSIHRISNEVHFIGFQALYAIFFGGRETSINSKDSTKKYRKYKTVPANTGTHFNGRSVRAIVPISSGEFLIGTGVN